MSKELIEALKESEEWKAFLLHVEEIVINEIKEHKGEAWWKVLFEIVMQSASKLSMEAIEAVNGSASIPEEWKNAGKDKWIEFAVDFLIQEGKILGSIFAK